MMKKTVSFLTTAICAFALSACTTGTQPPAPVVNGSAMGAGQAQTTSRGMGQQSDIQGMDTALQNGDTNVIYFALNKSSVLPQFDPIVNQFANYLLENSKAKIKISGYTDRSGSRSWNLSLSQHRAKAVAKVLMAKGVKASQIEVVGYGEEYTTNQCRDKQVCWQDRRAVINPAS